MQVSSLTLGMTARARIPHTTRPTGHCDFADHVPAKQTSLLFNIHRINEKKFNHVFQMSVLSLRFHLPSLISSDYGDLMMAVGDWNDYGPR